MTHRTARHMLGTRSLRRAGIDTKRSKSGQMRKTGKTRVAVAVRAIVRKTAHVI